MDEYPFKKQSSAPGASKQNTSESLRVSIEIAQMSDWEAFRDIRLDSLAVNPEAFRTKLENAIERTPEQWQADLSSDKIFYVLAKANSALNRAESVAGAVKEKEGIWLLVSVYTRPNYRKKGISEKVLSKTLEEIKNRGGTKATLFVHQGQKQDAARNLYKKLGFKEMESGKYHDRDFMTLDLDTTIPEK